MEIIAGTYEELTLGFSLQKIDEGYALNPSFTDHSHVGCVRAAAVSSKGVLATGSSDETIKLFHLEKRQELGALLHHEGSITDLTFFGGTHMFSGSTDGTVGVWKTNRWECIKTFKGHKGAVNSVAVHPTGKLAMTVGADKTLRLWNLITGKSAFVTNIKKAPDLVRWCPDGSKYLVVTRNQVDVYSVDTAKVIDTIAYEGTVHCLLFLKTGVLLAGLEDGKIAVHDLDRKEKIGEFTAHSLRVKGITTIHCKAEDKDFLVSVSSDGFVKVWDLAQEKDSVDATLIAEKNTTFRLVCVAAWSPAPKPEIDNSTSSKKASVEKETSVKHASEENDSSDTESKPKKRKRKKQKVNMPPPEVQPVEKMQSPVLRKEKKQKKQTSASETTQKKHTIPSETTKSPKLKQQKKLKKKKGKT
ncbi:p21-activated protein kinase-interacting protein 1-like isoform X2 [Lineus longissimus]|uniref:p21-activated protein kinase-interacting protein 1-like isoform X2 n=1 Tax=Lineus longissimus TaxID=88925 RepID=UPI00315D1887